MQYEVESSIKVLASEGAFSVPDRQSRNKWDGPWWHMAILCEIGEADKIPRSAVEQTSRQLNQGAWPKFVIKEEDAPQNEDDKAKMDCCHCELGVFYMALSACGCDVDEELSWIREWFLRHQLPDGGLNCDPGANLNSRKSSIVSSLPPLEAALRFTRRNYTKTEARFLDEGARYLIEHRLVCSKKTGRVLNGEWLKPFSPRFFEYEILRGMYYLVEWSKRRNKPLPAEVIEEGLDRLKRYTRESGVVIGRQVNDKNGDWHEDAFPLMIEVGKVGQTSKHLTKQLDTVLRAVRGA